MVDGKFCPDRQDFPADVFPENKERQRHQPFARWHDDCFHPWIAEEMVYP
jgi:hypothetical protein